MHKRWLLEEAREEETTKEGDNGYTRASAGAAGRIHIALPSSALSKTKISSTSDDIQ